LDASICPNGRMEVGFGVGSSPGVSLPLWALVGSLFHCWSWSICFLRRPPTWDSLPGVASWWFGQGWVGGSLAFAVPLRQAPLGGLLASAVATGWLFGGGSFLLGVFPPWLGLCSAPLLCLLPVLLALPVLPRQWVVEAFGGVGPRVRHGLGPSCLEGVVWRCPDASGVRVGAWFLAGGCHLGYVGGIRVVRGVWLGTGS
jgi:hypothetical protein